MGVCSASDIPALRQHATLFKYGSRPESNRFEGRAIAQAVSRWLPTATALVRARVWSSGICGGQIGVGAGCLRVLRFTLPKAFIPPSSPSSQSPGAGTLGQ
jgi:hypothetical protein